MKKNILRVLLLVLAGVIIAIMLTVVAYSDNTKSIVGTVGVMGIIFPASIVVVIGAMIPKSRCSSRLELLFHASAYATTIALISIKDFGLYEVDQALGSINPFVGLSILIGIRILWQLVVEETPLREKLHLK